MAELDPSFPMTFNVIQQGANDQFNIPLAETDQEGVYQGSFKITRSDGVYNKDGLAAIIINIPDPCMRRLSFPCTVDTIDEFNRTDSEAARDFYINYSAIIDDISSKTVLEGHKATRLSKSTDFTSLKAQYSADDPRFSFANPKYFNRKG